MMPSGSARAAVLTEYGEELSLREVPIPVPEPGALVVRVELATVCGSDVHAWQGALPDHLRIRPPLILGHEIVGTVAAIGSGAERDSVGRPLAVGDRVVWEHESCGACYACSVQREPTLCSHRRVGMFSNCELPPYSAGGFAEYSYIWPRAGRLRVPDGVRSEWAAAASCALRTVVGAFERLGPIDFLSTVLIQGSGPLGLFATALAAVYRPRRLVVVGAPAARLEIAREWGADAVISIEEHPDPEARAALIAEHTDGGPDVLFELSGARGAFAEGVRVAGRDARYAVVGTLGPGTQDVEVSRITTRGLRIVGCLGGDIGTYYKALEFMEREARTFNWDALFSGRRHGLETATDALEAQRTMTEIKPVVDPWSKP